MEMKFKDEDKDKVIEFLNLIATHGKFNLSTQEVIKYFQLLNYMQKIILPKIDANVMEVKRLIEPPKAQGNE